MGSAAPKPPHAIHPHSKLWGILAFSHERSTNGNPSIAPQASQPGEQQAGKEILSVCSCSGSSSISVSPAAIGPGAVAAGCDS